MSKLLYLTLSVCEIVILCIVNVLYFFNVLCNSLRVCNIVDWLLSLKWGVGWGWALALDVWIGVVEALNVIENEIIKDKQIKLC